MDLPAVNAFVKQATAAECANRDARAAELWGRAVVAAQALRQPDCLVAAFLRCLRCKALLFSSSLGEKLGMEAVAKREAEAKRLRTWELVYATELPAILSCIERRRTTGTLDPGTCREYETRFNHHFHLQHVVPALVGTAAPP